ncbi:MAG: ribonuclease III family protein [Fusobacteria bacterium]|nr:MAG: ribonuclease III family protein [Fusobacteriota bacterium]KAF0227924.1 MAG: ribonuclease III family [Fusobacteriota bacterium]
MEKEVSSLALAYLGDAVLEIHIRDYVIRIGKTKIDQLHRSAVKFVNAKAQSKVYDSIQSLLKDDEMVILRKGRNAKKNIPKNVEMVDYRKSTGVEALLGYLFLKGDNDRIKELVNYIIITIEGSESIENRES